MAQMSFQLQYLNNLITLINNFIVNALGFFFVLNSKYLNNIFSPALSRNFINCCNGTGAKGFPQSSARRWNCSIFSATSSSLQPEEAADLKQ